MLRPDQLAIASLIPDQKRIVDIGCGVGELLAAIENPAGLHGLELDADKVTKALKNGLPVIQGDADADLVHYADNGFDYAILGQTLQVMKQPKQVLIEALRIAEKVVVSVPNFGHIRNRSYLGLRGKMPVNESLPYAWYDTPNIHFCTIRDFVSLAEELSCAIEYKGWLNAKGQVKTFVGSGGYMPNLFGEYGLFILSKS